MLYFSRIFQSEWKLNLIIAYDVKLYIWLHLVIRCNTYVTFNKIYIYMELLLYQFYPFHYYNRYICCITDTFFQRTLKKQIFVIMVLQTVDFIQLIVDPDRWLILYKLIWYRYNMYRATRNVYVDLISWHVLYVIIRMIYVFAKFNIQWLYYQQWILEIINKYNTAHKQFPNS